MFHSDPTVSAVATRLASMEEFFSEYVYKLPKESFGASRGSLPLHKVLLPLLSAHFTKCSGGSELVTEKF